MSTYLVNAGDVESNDLISVADLTPGRFRTLLLHFSLTVKDNSSEVGEDEALKTMLQILPLCSPISAAFSQWDPVHKLEIEYAEKYAPLYARRAEIVAGDVEPSPTECVFPGEEADNDNETQDNDNESVSGIPGFWLTIFKNTEILAEMTQPHDEGILESLTDIRVSFPDSGMGFVLEFVFRENDFFEDKTLTKTYHMKSESDECDPVAFDGPEIVGSTGCNINWKKGKNVTQKVVKKKQRMKGKGQTRIIQKTIKEDSFFNFFAPPSMPEDDSESVDEELEALLTTDFEIGQYIRERIVPKAIWYFTNEVTDLESDIDDEASDDDYSDSSDYEDELENNENVVANETVTDVQKPEDCKQQ